MRDYSSWQCWLCATKNNKCRTHRGHCSDREGPALTSYEYVIQNGVWQVFVVLQVVVLKKAENYTLNWLLWKQPKPNAVSHKPHISQCCSLPMNAWPKGSCAKGCRQERLLQVYTAHVLTLSQGWTPCSQLQHQLWPSFRHHLYSPHIPCTTPECCPDNACLDVGVGPDGTPPTWVAVRVPHLSSSSQHPYVKTRKRGRKANPCWELAMLAMLLRKRACWYATKDNTCNL